MTGISHIVVLGEALRQDSYMYMYVNNLPLNHWLQGAGGNWLWWALPTGNLPSTSDVITFDQNWHNQLFYS